MPNIRGANSAPNNNLIQGDGLAQFVGPRWVEVHALQVLGGDTPADPAAPAVNMVYSNGQVTMSKGPVPVLNMTGANVAARDPGATIIGFTEATLIFAGWVQGTSEAEQVLQLVGDPPTDSFVYWQFSHRAQP